MQVSDIIGKSPAGGAAAPPSSRATSQRQAAASRSQLAVILHHRLTQSRLSTLHGRLTRDSQTASGTCSNCFNACEHGISRPNHGRSVITRTKDRSELREVVAMGRAADTLNMLSLLIIGDRFVTGTS